MYGYFIAYCFYCMFDFLNSVVIGLSITAVIVLIFLITLLVFLCIGRCRQQTEQNQQTQGVYSTLRHAFGLISICYFFNFLQMI